MAYSSPDDLRRAYPKVLTTGLTADELAATIALADAYIDGLLGARYVVPFAATPTATPPLIRALSWSLALGFVYDRSQHTPDWVGRVLARADQLLTQLATGALVVVDPTGAVIPARTDIGVPHSTVEGYVPVFGTVPSLAETFDPDRRDDEDARRK